MEVARLNETLEQLKQNIEHLNGLVEARDRLVEELEHEKQILQIDARGMTSVNARLTKWIETIRTAEEKPLTGYQSIKDKLTDIENDAE